MTAAELAQLREEMEQLRTRAEAAEAENAELRQAAVVATGRAALFESESVRVVRAAMAFGQEPFSPRARRDLVAAVGKWQLHTAQPPGQPVNPETS